MTNALVAVLENPESLKFRETEGRGLQNGLKGQNPLNGFPIDRGGWMRRHARDRHE